MMLNRKKFTFFLWKRTQTHMHTWVMSFTEQLQEAEKVTGKLIILHDLLTWQKGGNTHPHTDMHTHPHTEMHTHTCRHTYAQAHTQVFTNIHTKQGHVQAYTWRHTHIHIDRHTYTKKVREHRRTKQTA